LPAFKSPSQARLFNDAALANLFSFFDLGKGWAGISYGKEQLWILITAG
jgi:hypothetical protein